MRRRSIAGGAFDLVVSTTSFDHWQDQLAGRLLLRAGFSAPQWHRLYAGIIQAATATRLTITRR